MNGIGISGITKSMLPDHQEYTISFNKSDLEMKPVNDIPEGYISSGKIGLFDSDDVLYFIIEQVEKIE